MKNYGCSCSFEFDEFDKTRLCDRSCSIISNDPCSCSFMFGRTRTNISVRSMRFRVRSSLIEISNKSILNLSEREIQIYFIFITILLVGKFMIIRLVFRLAELKPFLIGSFLSDFTVFWVAKLKMF